MFHTFAESSIRSYTMAGVFGLSDILWGFALLLDAVSCSCPAHVKRGGVTKECEVLLAAIVES